MTIQLRNLKYAMRAGSDVTLECTVYDMERRGSLEMRRLDITDGIVTSRLALFGAASHTPVISGHRIIAYPIWYNEQYGNFTLRRGGTIHIS